MPVDPGPTNSSANMELYLPVDGYMNWGDEMRYNLDRIDQHDHTSTKGAPIGDLGVMKRGEGVLGDFIYSANTRYFDTGSYVRIMDTVGLEIVWGNAEDLDGAFRALPGPAISLRNEKPVTSANPFAGLIMAYGNETVYSHFEDTRESYDDLLYFSGDQWIVFQRPISTAVRPSTGIANWMWMTDAEAKLARFEVRMRPPSWTYGGTSVWLEDHMPTMLAVDTDGNLHLRGEIRAGGSWHHIGLDLSVETGDVLVPGLWIHHNPRAAAADEQGFIYFPRTSNRDTGTSGHESDNDLTMNIVKNMDSYEPGSGFVNSFGFIWRHFVSAAWSNFFGVDYQGNLWAKGKGRFGNTVTIETGGAIITGDVTITGALTISGGFSGGTGYAGNNKVKVSAADTTPADGNYLFSKLQAGAGISLSIVNAGAEEKVQITNTTGGTDTFKVRVSAGDTEDYLGTKIVGSPTVTVNQNANQMWFDVSQAGQVRVESGDGLGYLDDKIEAGTNVIVTTTGAAGNRKLQISASVTGGGSTDTKVALDASDAAGYLAEKLVAGTGITITEVSGPRRLQISYSGTGGGGGSDDRKLKNFDTDTTPGFLNEKLIAGSGIIMTPILDGGVYKTRVSVSTSVSSQDFSYVVFSHGSDGLPGGFVGYRGAFMSDDINARFVLSARTTIPNPNLDNLVNGDFALEHASNGATKWPAGGVGAGFWQNPIPAIGFSFREALGAGTTKFTIKALLDAYGNLALRGGIKTNGENFFGGDTDPSKKTWFYLNGQYYELTVGAGPSGGTYDCRLRPRPSGFGGISGP